MPVTAGALLTSACVNGSVGLACAGLFGVLRRWHVTARLYQPKRFTGGERVGRPPRLAAPLPQGLLSWIGPVMRCPEPEVVDLCGLDVAVFFRLLHLGVKLFSFVSVFCLLLVMPVNLQGGYLERHKRPPHDPANLGQPAAAAAAAGPSGPSGLLAGLFPLQQQHPHGLAGLGNFTDAIHTDLDLLTLANVPPGSDAMWVHVAAVYVITLVALKLLWDLSRDVAFKRAQFLATEGARMGPAGSSVLVGDIPGLESGTPLARLQLSWVKWLLPDGVFRRGCDAQLLRRRQQQQQALPLPLSRQPTTGAAASTPAPASAAAAGTDDGAASAALAVQDVWEEAVQQLQASGGDVQALVEREMRQVYGADSVAAVVPVYDTRALEAAAAQYCKLQAQLEDVLDWYQCRLPPPQQQHPQHDDEEAAGPPDSDQQLQPLSASGAAAAAAAKRRVGSLQEPLLPSSPAGSWRAKPGGGAGRHRLQRKTVLVVGPRWGAWGVERFGVAPCKVDALTFYTAALTQQLTELQQQQADVLTQLPRPAAFVLFRGQLISTLAAASLHCYDETAWNISPAPQPEEVEWRYLGIRSWELAVRQLLLWGCFWLLVVFYAPLVAAIQAPVNMDNLKKVPILAQLLALPLVTSLLQGFLPSVVLLIFLAVMPYLLAGLIRRSGLHSTAAVDAQLVSMFFLFQLFAVFIFSFISGTALSQLQGLIDDPHRIISLLGVSAPQQASFFSTWILLLGLSRAPLQLLRLPQLAWYLLRLPLADSPRARRRLWADQQQLLGYVLPLHTLVLLLGLVFCVASPLIAPITLLYFAAASVVQRYQWLYAYRHPYEGAGMLWQQVFAQVMVGVYFFVAVMGCLLAIKRFGYALLLLPLAAGVLVFHVLADRALQRPLTLPSAREAAIVDHSAQAAAAAARAQQQQQPGPDRQGGSNVASAAANGGGDGGAASASHHPQSEEAEGEAGLRERYLAPCLRLNQAQLQPLLDEAAEVQARLAALGL